MKTQLPSGAFRLLLARVGLTSGLALAAAPGLAADTVNNQAADDAAVSDGAGDVASFIANFSDEEAASFLDGWVDGNGVWYPYCTNSGDTGGGFGWQPELGGPNGGSCKIYYGNGGGGGGYGGGGYGTPPQAGMIWIDLGGGRWGWGWGRGHVGGGRGGWGGGRGGYGGGGRGGWGGGGRGGYGGGGRGGYGGGGHRGGGGGGRGGRGGRHFTDEAVTVQQVDEQAPAAPSAQP